MLFLQLIIESFQDKQEPHSFNERIKFNKNRAKITGF